GPRVDAPRAARRSVDRAGCAKHDPRTATWRRTMASLDPLPRRTFLGLTAAFASACARRSSQPTTSSAPLSSAEPWEAIRALFPLSRESVHLASFLLASHPKPVADAIEQYRRELDANPVLTIESELAHKQRTSRVRASAARYLGSGPDEIALTDSTTM